MNRQEIESFLDRKMAGDTISRDNVIDMIIELTSIRSVPNPIPARKHNPEEQKEREFIPRPLHERIDTRIK